MKYDYGKCQELMLRLLAAVGIDGTKTPVQEITIKIPCDGIVTMLVTVIGNEDVLEQLLLTTIEPKVVVENVQAINPGMDKHASRQGLGHWKCTDANGNSTWRRCDGAIYHCKFNLNGGYPEELRDFDRKHPIGR